MPQETSINSHEDVSMTNINLNYRSATDNHLSCSNRQDQNIIKEEQQPIHNAIRAKSVDYPRTASTMVSSSNIRATTIYIDALHRIEEEDEQKGLNILNNRFADYLEKIKHLADTNINLHRQSNDIYQKYMGHSTEEKFNNLRRRLNNEGRQLITVQTRLQRADYDKKYYKNKLQSYSASDQSQINKAQLDANVYELSLLKEQYEKQEQELESCRRQYNEYKKKLIEYTDEYNNINYERMQSENSLHTLTEQLLFEREYNQRCREEFEHLEKIQYDSNNHFNNTEFENIIRTIREDYHKYNETQVSELEILYRIKLESMQNDFHKDEKQNPSDNVTELIEQNRSLQQKFKQLEYDLNHISEQNQQQYETSNDEYNQLNIQVPELESLILHSRDNTVHLSSEINTYRCLLINLVSSTQQKTKPTPGFDVHLGNGFIWVRI